MVQITIKIRPQRSYTYANSIKQVTVDSSYRFEQILSQLNLSKKGTSLYKSSNGIIPLNSAIASHNIQDNEIIETCSSPILSALLSATIGDIEHLQQNIDENNRTSDVIKSLLMDTDPSNDYFESYDWEPTRWSFKDARRRLICLKTMKQLVQRNGRYATIDAPQCNDLNSLYDFIQTSGVFRHNKDINNKSMGGFSSIEHCFKPKAKNRHGKPSVLWDLVQQKMDKFNKIVIDNIDHNSNFDPIEAFVKVENERQNTNSAKYTNTTTMSSPSTDLIDNTQQQETQIGQRRKRHNIISSSNIPEEANQTHIQLCVSCKLNGIRCICLTPSCPFVKKPFCNVCFNSNHPITIRNHECIPWNDPRAKAAWRQMQKEYAGQYCPEYKSGPFSILCTLYEAMYRHTGTRRQLNLTEKKLKELAQPRCRANLYDRQARGRTAFACMERLTSDGFLRKEIIPGSNGNSSSAEEENTTFSLLPKGEKLAKFCLEFEDSINSVVENEEMKKNRSIALTGCYDTANRNSRNSDNVSIIIDSREDKLFAKRLMNRCQTSSVNYILRDLPAGDYLFTTKVSTINGQQQQSDKEMVSPLVIERKTWSDLADSVSGHGRKRLDCVKIDSSCSSNENTNEIICNTNCQLCKMKKSSCPQIMFIIEGARCLNRDDEKSRSKCTTEKRCKFCKELQERHGRSMIHLVLEDVLHRLQVDHRCLIHFTRDYNETINSLFVIREIFEADIRNKEYASSLILTYQEFSSKARRRNIDSENVSNVVNSRGKVVEWKDEYFIKNIHTAKMPEILSCFSSRVANTGRKSAVVSQIIDLEPSFPAKPDANYNGDEDEESTVICIDSDSDEVSANSERIANTKGNEDEEATVVCIDSDQDSEDVSLESVEESIKILDDDGNWSSNKVPKNIPGMSIDIDPIQNNIISQDSVNLETDDISCNGLRLDKQDKLQIIGSANRKTNNILDIESALKREDSVQIIESINRNANGTHCSKFTLQREDSVQILEPSNRSANGVSELKLNREDSVQIIESVNRSRNFIHSNEISLKKQDSVQIEQPINFRTNNTSSNESGTTRERRNDLMKSSTAPTLLLLEGLYEYDTEYHYDVNKIWKSLYLENRNRERNFFELSKKELNRLQGNETQTPFINRETIDFWILLIQLRCNVILHTARQHACASKLNTLWSGGQSRTSVSNVRIQTSTPRSIGSIEQNRTSLPIEISVSNCTLNRSILPDIREARPMGTLEQNQNASDSNFTRNRSRLSDMRGTRSIGSIDQNRISLPTARKVSTSTTKTSKICDMREARLRRFESSSPAPKRRKPTNQSNQSEKNASSDTTTNIQSNLPEEVIEMVNDNDFWDCPQCTYKIGNNGLRCPMCDYTPSQQTPTFHSTFSPELALSNEQYNGASFNEAATRYSGLDLDFTTSIASPETQLSSSNAASSSRSSTRSKGAAKCGACGQIGHNRGSATPQNCAAYENPSEVAWRKKRKDEATRKVIEARRAQERLLEESERSKSYAKDLEETFRRMQQSQESSNLIREREVARLEKERKRAEARSRRL